MPTLARPIPADRSSEVAVSQPRLRSLLTTARAARVANDLGAAMTERHVTAGRLAMVLDVSRTVVDRWLPDERGVPDRGVPVHEVEAMPACVGEPVLEKALARIRARKPCTIEASPQLELPGVR
jgi:hypothetical protein